MVSNRLSSRLESVEQILCAALLGSFSKCALGKRDADVRRIVSLRSEKSGVLALSPAANLPLPPPCPKLVAFPIRPFYNT
jgi:hypothetical protein